MSANDLDLKSSGLIIANTIECIYGSYSTLSLRSPNCCLFNSSIPKFKNAVGMLPIEPLPMIDNIAPRVCLASKSSKSSSL